MPRSLFVLLAIVSVFSLTSVGHSQSSTRASQKPTPKPTASATPSPTPVPTPVLSGPGSVDASFGQNGRALFQSPLPNSSTPVHRRSVLQSDGKIVVLLMYDQDGIRNLLVRLDADGTVDETFGTGGYVQMTWGGIGSGFAFELTKQIVHNAELNVDEERFVIAGTTPCGRKTCTRAERYTSAGAFDTTFGTAGSTTLSVEGPRAMTVQPEDQKIVLVNGVGFVIRLTADGLPDPGFGSGGVRSISGLGFLGVAVTSSGRILACGRTTTGSLNFAVVQLNSNGSLDDGGTSDSTPGDSFGTGGKALTDFDGYTEEAYSVVVDPIGRIIASGQAQMGGGGTYWSYANAVLVRYYADGRIDTSFGNGGKTWLDIGGRQDLFTTLALQNDGKIVATGEGRYSGTAGADFLTARYNDDGTIDASFGIGGWVMTDGFGFYDQARSIHMQSDPGCGGCEKILITGGFSTSNITSQAAAIRINQ